MHSEIMLRLSVSLGLLIRTQHKWLVPSLVVLMFALKSNLLQGELAHRLVKRLYGLTNKKDAPEQIAHRYRRAHHFKPSEPSDPSQPDDSPEFHHSITASRNDSIELASFSSSKTRDPAAKVGFSTPQRNLSSHPSSRILSTNSVSISSVDSSTEVLMAMTLAFLRTKSGTRFGSSITSYLQQNSFP